MENVILQVLFGLFLISAAFACNVIAIYYLNIIFLITSKEAASSPKDDIQSVYQHTPGSHPENLP